MPTARCSGRVDGAVDGEVADVAAGEEPRTHDERVGAHRDPAAVDAEDSGVAELGEHAAVVAVRREQQVLHEVRRQRTATPMAHDDLRVVAQRHRAGPALEIEVVGHRDPPATGDSSRRNW